MSARLYLVVIAVICATGFVESARIRPDAYLGLRYEPGVETRLLLASSVEWDLVERAKLFGGFAVGAIDNLGIAHYGIGVSSKVIDFAKLRLQAQVNHDEWTSWQVGENRAAGMVFAEPLPRLELGIGLAWRAPIYDPEQYHSPFKWSSQAPEWNWIYRLDWTFFTRDGIQVALWFANLDRLTIHNPQQFPSGLRASYAVWQHWRLTAQIGTAIKGLSALLLRYTEMDLRLGVSGEL